MQRYVGVDECVRSVLAQFTDRGALCVCVGCMLPATVWSHVAEYLGLRLSADRASSVVELALFAEQDAYLNFQALLDADDWDSYLDDLCPASDVSSEDSECLSGSVGTYIDYDEGEEEESSTSSSSWSGPTYALRRGLLVYVAP